MQWAKTGVLYGPVVGGLSRAFPSRVEDSLRLRLTGLAAFWVVAIAIARVGGGPGIWLGAGIAATCGHAYSWHRRHQGASPLTLVIGMIVIGLAMLMGTDMLAGLQGNWLPLAYFLLLLQAMSSFDIRTRTGLYAGLALSGIVLFFASQHAFDLRFGIFLLSYAGLLIAFLATAYLEDESRAAVARPGATGVPLVGFWSVTAVFLLLLSVLAFMLLPRGEGNAPAYQGVAALPITVSPEGYQPALPIQVGGRSSASPSTDKATGGASPYNGGAGSSETPGGGAPVPPPGMAAQEGPGAGLAQQPTGVDDALAGSDWGSDTDGIIMHVRSPVASYWRGQVFDSFDGTAWYPQAVQRLDVDAGYVARDAVRYVQTFFIHQAQPGATFMGYRAVGLVMPEGSAYQESLSDGTSYRVVSVHPELVPERLRDDKVGPAGSRFHRIPTDVDWLRGLAHRTTAGLETDFDRMVRLVEFVGQSGRYDVSAPNQLNLSAPLRQLLLENEPGTSLDFATATVLLARAAGLPSRLAVGYLPGDRDPLSGAYAVRGKHVHSWAEIFFQEHGWVPFDAAPRPDLDMAALAGGSQLGGLTNLFQSSLGDELLSRAMAAPSGISSGYMDMFTSPMTASVAALPVGVIALSLGWFGIRLMWQRRRRREGGWQYEGLSGDGRDEMRRINRHLERLVRKRGIQKRNPGQTLGEYSQMVAQQFGGVEEQMAWFTQLVRGAAYNPRWKPSTTVIQMVQDARERLTTLDSNLKQALQGT